MNVLILGANSDIGMALAHKFARADKANIYLASRNMGELEKNAADLQHRYQVGAAPYFFDATDYGSHDEFYRQLEPRPDIVVAAFGYLGDQQLGQRDFAEAKKIIDRNFTGAVSILEIVAADFEARGRGAIIVISSVAGDRGRQANYLYGAAKAGLTAFASGLRNRLYRSNVKVLTVLPGFVRTKMTEGMDLPPLLLADPEKVAEDIHRAYARVDILYTKKIWRPVMLCIRSIPERIFKKMNI